MLNSRLVILDFDSTLFNVRLFLADLTNLLAKKFDINLERFDVTYEQMRTAGGGYSTYDHMKFLGLPKAEIDALLDKKSFPNEYAYQGVTEAIAKFQKTSDVIIWTLGDARFQEFKRAFIPALKNVAFIITHDKSAKLPDEIVRKEDGVQYNSKLYKSVVLIDDNPKNFFDSPPIYLRQIRVRYPGGRYSKIETPKGVEEAANLADIVLQ